MSPFSVCRLTLRVAQAYHTSSALHGDLSLDACRYFDRVEEVLKRYLGPACSEEQALNFFDHLHVADLYLTTACALPSDAGWCRFHQQYRSFIQQVAAYVSATLDAASDLAESLPAYLFLPDQSGRCRIASYEGRSSLATWLATILNHQAIRERERKCNTLERLEDLPELADHSVVPHLDSQMRTHRYEPCIRESFALVSQGLNERERLILTLRYQEGMEGAEIARLLDIHPSTVSRTLRSVYAKLRSGILSALASRHHLNEAGLEECVADILENPEYSILSMLGQDG